MKWKNVIDWVNVIVWENVIDWAKDTDLVNAIAWNQAKKMMMLKMLRKDIDWVKRVHAIFKMT